MYKTILHSLRGSNLEVFKFGMYILFPIGWMYYFGTNLDSRFSVEGFWPTAEQSHKIPFEREEIKNELERMKRRSEYDAAVRKGLREAQGEGNAQRELSG